MPGSVPHRWAEAHPGEQRSWLPEDIPLRIPKVENCLSKPSSASSSSICGTGRAAQQVQYL
jgi:hypothetical protein